MSLNIKPISITSDEVLLEHVLDALPNILGKSCKVVTDDLPFDGNLILALNAKQQLFVVSCDHSDAGRALLSGLSAIEGMMENRAILYRLYPNVFNNNNSLYPVEDTNLVVLAPKPPPGGAYLQHAFRFLSVYTYHR